MLTSDFDYELPPELIAQEPPPERGDSRMLVLNRNNGCLAHRNVADLPEYLDSGDLLVLGFSLNSWAFRALYTGLIKSDDARAEKRGICVQLPPSEAERAYLHDYLQREARFEVDWRTLSAYAAGLPRV